MREMLLNDLRTLYKYRDIKEEGLRGLIYLTTLNWTKHYEFMTPTHKNIELIDMLDRNFPEIKWINKPKLKEDFNFMDVIYNSIQKNLDVENILQFIIDRSIIVFTKDEAFEKYKEVVNVTKIMGGGRKPPIRRIKLFDKSNERISDYWYKTHLKNFISENLLDEKKYIQSLYYNNNWMHAWIDTYVDVNLSDLKVGQKDVIKALINDDSTILKRAMRQARKEIKTIAESHPLFKRTKYRILNSQGSQATIQIHGLSLHDKRKIIRNNDARLEFIKKYKFDLAMSVNRYSRNKNDCLTFVVRVGLCHQDFMNSVYELFE